MSDNSRAEAGASNEKSRPARAGETDMTRSGMEESAAEEPNATGGPDDETGDAGNTNSDEDVR